MKEEIISQSVEEARRAQIEPWTPPPVGTVKKLSLPPYLPLGDGRQLPATAKLISYVKKYADLRLANDPSLRSRFKNKELEEIARRAFGKALAKIDLVEETSALLSSAKLEIDSNIDSEISRSHKRLEATFGCELLKNAELYPVSIGPVTFQTKEQWRRRALKNSYISETTSRRLKKLWIGKSLRKRKRSQDSMREESVVDTIDSSSTVCTVVCDGLSPKMMEEKSLMAARLGMCAVSLMWSRPSQGLQWMNLLYDGNIYHQHYALFGEAGLFGSSSSISQMPEGVWTDDQFEDHIKQYVAIFDLLGEVLRSYVQPVQKVRRPNVLSALFLSLWWFYEGCREGSDQIATTKFSASIDALAKGKGSKGIVKLVEARLGRKPKDQLVKNGQTTEKVAEEIYDSGRSRLIHGSSKDYSHDWGDRRAKAEAVARLCLVETAAWLSENSEIDSVGLISSTR